MTRSHLTKWPALETLRRSKPSPPPRRPTQDQRKSTLDGRTARLAYPGRSRRGMLLLKLALDAVSAFTPSGLKASPAGCLAVQLTWSSSEAAPGPLEYRVESTRWSSEESPGPVESVLGKIEGARVSTSGLTLHGLRPGSRYQFRVQVRESEEAGDAGCQQVTQGASSQM